MAYGEMGMLESEFNESTPLYFVRRLNGMRKREYERSKERWEQTRMIMLYSGNFDKPTSATDIILFPWEYKSKKEIMSLQEFSDEIDRQNWPTPKAIA